MKDNPITIGFDDAAFELHSEIKHTQLIGVICQGTRMVGVTRDKIMIDGEDATEKLIKLVKENEKQVQYVLTHSITLYFHCKGIEIKEVQSLLKKICIDSKLPESVRLAHLIGKLF